MAALFRLCPNPVRTDAYCADGFKKTSTVEFHHESPSLLEFYLLNAKKSHYANMSASFA
jgi:hypothetical protein